MAGFRALDEQPPPEKAAIHVSLLRRLLAEEEGVRRCLRVPLTARWLRHRG